MTRRLPGRENHLPARRPRGRFGRGAAGKGRKDKKQANETEEGKRRLRRQDGPGPPLDHPTCGILHRQGIISGALSFSRGPGGIVPRPPEASPPPTPFPPTPHIFRQ